MLLDAGFVAYRTESIELISDSSVPRALNNICSSDIFIVSLGTAPSPNYRLF